MKFVCKDFWAEVFRKNIDNLRTNKRCVGGAAGGAGCRERRGGTHWVCPQCGRRAQLALPANAAWPQWPIHVWARDAAAARTTSVLQRGGGHSIHSSFTHPLQQPLRHTCSVACRGTFVLRDNNFRWLSRLSQNQVPSAIGQGPQVRMAHSLPVVGGLAEVLVVL